MKQQEIANLRQQILDDHACRELASGAKSLVMGSGNLDADIVMIGEAPGKKEDETGKPFVGASGKFLDQMLDSVGLSRSDIYITNIVKYRPPDNRDPSPDEKRAFWPYLESQLAIIQPKAVVTLGRHSMECFLPGEKISLLHGQVIDLDGRDYSIIPLYHPAVALYNGRMRQVLLSDFRVLLSDFD